MAVNFDIKNDRQLQIALAAAVILLVVIISIFMNNRAYSESGQEYYLTAAIGGTALLFWGLRSFKLVILIPAALIILISLTVSTMKFDWRKAYIEKAEGGDPFIFAEYIDDYPTFEEFMKAQLIGGPDWIGFARVCAEPAKANQPYPDICSDLKTIKSEFGLDMKQIVKGHHRKMKMTAKKIADGKLKDKRRYEVCLQNKQCVLVPLLPANVDPDNIKGDQYRQIRQAFWSLVEEEEMTNIVCNQMELCRLLVKMKALNISDL